MRWVFKAFLLLATQTEWECPRIRLADTHSTPKR